MLSAKRLLCQPSKYRAIIRLALPMILSSSGMVVMQFIDGVFLCQHDPVDMGAAGTSGCLAWMLGSCIFGVVNFTSVLTSNMVGAKLESRVGMAIWQGLYLSFLGGAVTFALSFLSEAFYLQCGHVPGLAHREGVYLRILLAGSVFHFAQTAVSGFFAGRGDNVRLMASQLAGQVANVVGDYVLIFGKWGFPEMGIAGAAIATVLSALVPLVIQMFWFLNGGNRRTYNTLHGWHWNTQLVRQLLKLGIPSGIQHFVDAGIWSVFLVIVGRIGVMELTATNLSFRLNSLALLPVLGIGKAAATFVGQSHGRMDHGETLEYAGHSAVLCQTWMVTVALTYFLFPSQYMAIFLDSEAVVMDELMSLGTKLLRFVAVYCLADALNVSFCCSLQAVGDTRFLSRVMCLATAVLGVALFVADALNCGLFVLWTLATLYVMSLPPFWYMRLKGDKWKDIQVAQ